jgi:hypothetical protein
LMNNNCFLANNNCFLVNKRTDAIQSE